MRGVERAQGLDKVEREERADGARREGMQRGKGRAGRGRGESHRPKASVLLAFGANVGYIPRTWCVQHSQYCYLQNCIGTLLHCLMS